MAYLSKLSANLSLNIRDFRKGLEDGQMALKAFERSSRRTLNNLAGRGSGGGGFTQSERFRAAMTQGRAAGLDSDTLRRARSRQAAFTTGGRFGSARDTLGGLSGGSQMDLGPMFQRAAASVQKMNAELATSKTLTASTYREALRDVRAFEAAVVSARDKEASMTKANQQLSSLVAGGQDIQRDQQRSAEALDKQRSTNLYRLFQEEERLQKQAAEKAKASDNALSKQREKNLYKEFQAQERNAAKLAALKDKALAAEAAKSIRMKFNPVANQEFFSERNLGVATAKLQAFRGIMGQVGTQTVAVSEKFQRLAMLQEKATTGGVTGMKRYAAEIARTEKELAQLIAAEARAGGINVGGAGGIMRQVKAAGGKAGFASGFGDVGFMAQQLAFAFEDAAMSTDGLRGAIRGMTNNLTLLATMAIPGIGGAFASLGIIIGGQLISSIYAWLDAQNEEVNAEKKRTEALKEAAKEVTRFTAILHGVRDAAQGVRNSLKEATTAGMTSDEVAASERKAEARRQRNVIADEFLIDGGGARTAGYDKAYRDVVALEKQISMSESKTERERLTNQLGGARERLGIEREASLELSSRGGRDTLGQAFDAIAILEEQGRKVAEMRESGDYVGGENIAKRIQEIREKLLKAIMDGGFNRISFKKVLATAQGFTRDLEENMEKDAAYMREQEAQKAQRERRQADLDAYVGTTDMAREEKIAEFLRGGALAGVSADQLRSEARAQFGGTEEDQVMRPGGISKAPIGAADLRDAAGAAEQTRMLAGQDSAAATRDINMKQLEVAERTNELIDRLISVQPELAE